MRVSILRSLEALAGSVVFATIIPDLDRQRRSGLCMDADLAGTVIGSIRADKLHTELRCCRLGGCVHEAADQQSE